MTSTEKRVIIPLDVYARICVEVKKTADMVLQAALLLHKEHKEHKEMNMLPEENGTLKAFMGVNIQLGHVEGLLLAVLEPEGEANG